MAGSQTLLVMGAIAIFMYMGVTINRVYVNAAQQTNNNQQQIEAVNYGLSLSNEMYSQSFNYDSLAFNYGNLNDLSNSATRKNFVSNLGDSLAATIILSAEQPLVLGVDGRIATITVFTKIDGSYRQMSQHAVSIIPFN